MSSGAPANAIASTRPASLRLAGAMLTDVGCVRSTNQDSVAFVVPPEGGAGEQDCLLLVADGMGGHAAGEVASALAAEVVRRVFYSLSGAVPERLRAAFQAANAAILEYSQKEPDCAGMGTTCTTLAVRDGRAWLAHVGDSRAYAVRDGAVTQLTQDQTLVARMVREGTLTQAEAKASEYTNVILQALGTQQTVEPEIWDDGLPLHAGDSLVLCSDGLYNLVADEIIARTATTLPPLDACQALIANACAAGGHDNISVGIFRVDQALETKQPGTSTRRILVPQELAAGTDDSSSAATRRIPMATRS
jgi:protein phosphatase